ncbi:MAG: bifunctional (p)ppGpp synthetase/guanosine-3',5'-bis(diphosphate) 3'-pyrophosphohydrolase [bacterium]|nr:bifunctional (p)ppGpp synthetase/guanosine-3',5'-bis(diphosphate) 3'-pyrophosphohydrolase [bacterium]
MSLAELTDRIKQLNPAQETGLIDRAYQFAEKAHRGQMRLSGGPYVSHCLEVGKILAELQLDLVTISAGLLHDTIEDTAATQAELSTEFGPEIATLVAGVSKISAIAFRSQEERLAENFRKMVIAMAEDVRVLLIKLADRLHNMRTLEFLPVEKQKRISKDTLDIYAPLAHRLGIGKMKSELEDLSLRYLSPEVYFDLVERVAKKRHEREAYIENIKETLQTKLAEFNIPAEISGRPKYLYSVYRKMQRQKKELSEIYDLTAVRIITDTVHNCYAALGIVHTLWTPIHGGFDDYIAMPKTNMYQSLHTTVVGLDGEPVEIQIRTKEMHLTAESGIAAHWLYKEKKSSQAVQTPQYEKEFAWLRQILDWQQELRDPKEFMEALKIDIFSDQVFVFTPKGEVKELPAGSTPVDFAFAVHTEVGNRCVSAKVNGKIVPLRTLLKTGDIVEIITGKTARPSRDWLHFVRTSRARNKIQHYLKTVDSEQYIADGKETLIRELRAVHLHPYEIFKSERFAEISAGFGFSNPADLFINVALGKVSPKQVTSKLVPQPEPVPEKPVMPKPGLSEEAVQSREGIKVKGIQDVLIRFAKCCRPVPGDSVIGFITRGRGVSIHKKDCVSLLPFLSDVKRTVTVDWDLDKLKKHLVPIKVEMRDRPGTLAAVLAEIANLELNVHSSVVKNAQNNRGIGIITLEIIRLEQLNTILDRLRQIPNVLSVARTKRMK